MRSIFSAQSVLRQMNSLNHAPRRWVSTRPVIEPLYRTVLIPGLGAFGVMFGLWYAGF